MQYPLTQALYGIYIKVLYCLVHENRTVFGFLMCHFILSFFFYQCWWNTIWSLADIFSTSHISFRKMLQGIFVSHLHVESEWEWNTSVRAWSLMILNHTLLLFHASHLEPWHPQRTPPVFRSGIVLLLWFTGLILLRAEVRLRAAVIVLRRGVVVSVMLLVVVVLRCGVKVVMVVVSLDVPIGKQHRGSGGGRLRGHHAARQSPITWNGAVPSGCSHLRSGRQEAGPVSSTVNAPGQVIITVVASGVVKEICSRAKAVAVDHPSRSLTGTRPKCHYKNDYSVFTFIYFFYQVLVGFLDAKENHHKACRQQLPEEQDDSKYNVSLAFLHIRLQHRQINVIQYKWAGLEEHDCNKHRTPLLYA